jgi:hypothetical protein
MMEIMNIYAKNGDKVIFCYPDNGYEHDQEYCKKHLTLNGVYTVELTEVGQSYSSVILQEIPNKSFNTVMFRDFAR